MHDVFTDLIGTPTNSQHIFHGGTMSATGNQHDPLDQLAAAGVRVIWVDDFDKRIVLVDDDAIALVDCRISRRVAAHSLRLALGLRCACFDQPA